MKYQELGELIKDYRKNRRAIPAFNYSDMWDLKAIINAAARNDTPVIVASNPFVAQYHGLDLCHCIVDTERRKVDIPVFHHLDHSLSTELCIEAVDAGYDSVMIDGSGFPLQKNIEMVSQVLEYAHSKNVLVEGEIGRIKGRGIEGVYTGDEYLARVEDVVEFTEKTAVDMLAVGIGTAHGFYEGEPKIHFDRLEEIAKAVDVPLVLHGGTGIPNEDIKRTVHLGISKVNIGTIIHSTYMNCLRNVLRRSEKNPYTLDIMQKVLLEVERIVEDRIWVIARD